MSTADLPTLPQLRQMGLGELERLYAAEVPLAVPTGRFRGIFLEKLETPGARKPVSRLVSFVGFQATPFGVDFDSCCWFFWHPRLLIGRFQPELGPSRWRDTETVRLDYEVSRLPTPVRSVLYDEVKPLSEAMCLGIGGLNAGRGEGDLFFFALDRIA